MVANGFAGPVAGENLSDSEVAPVARKKGPSRRAFVRRARDAALVLAGKPPARQIELIAAINVVAEAVSSARSVENVLSVIVERAKSITTTDKAILVLTGEHTFGLDMDTIVVRGRRGQHAQQWWQARLEALGESVFQTGEPFVEHHPEEQAIILATPLLVRDEPIGLLCAINSEDRPFTQDQLDFAEILSAFAASAVENARLAEQSRYVLLASERDRIAREMHDGVVQSLFSISLGLELCKKQITHNPEGVAARIEEQQQHLNTAMMELRRFIYDLRPMKLTELGFVGATEYWVREITQGRAVRGRVVVEGIMPNVTPAQEACLYRVAKEAVSNIVRHASAETFEVHIGASEETVVMTVRDDGDGFDAELMLRGGTPGLGLKSIHDRVVREGGSLSVESSAGRGTVLKVELGGLSR